MGSMRRRRPSPKVSPRPSAKASAKVAPPIVTTFATTVAAAREVQRSGNSLEVVLQAWAALVTRDDEQARRLASALDTLIQTELAGDQGPAALLVRRAKPGHPMLTQTAPTRAEAARMLVRLVSDAKGTGTLHALPLRAAIYLHQHRALFDLEDTQIEAAAAKIRVVNFGEPDEEKIAKTILKALGLSEDVARNIISSAQSTIR